MSVPTNISMYSKEPGVILDIMDNQIQFLVYTKVVYCVLTTLENPSPRSLAITGLEGSPKSEFLYTCSHMSIQRSNVQLWVFNCPTVSNSLSRKRFTSKNGHSSPFLTKDLGIKYYLHAGLHENLRPQ